jgi:UTP--glucose-1-phosphate uridylyltransferase
MNSSKERKPSSSIKKAVFPAAGLGTRFLPATKAQPKEMLPLVDKPLIQYGVEEAVASGIRNIIIITGRGKNAIEDHFDVSYELEKFLENRKDVEKLKIVKSISDLVSFSYIRQKEALGLGHAVYAAKDLLNNESFAVILGDDIIDAEIPCLKQLIKIYEKRQATIFAVQKIPKEDISKYGVIGAVEVDKRLYKVNQLVEKPSAREAPSNLAIIGRYILTPRIFNAILKVKPDSRGEIQLTNAINMLVKEEPVYAYEFVGTRYDAGNKLGFLIATVELALKRKDLGKDFKDYLLTLDLEPTHKKLKFID